MGSWVPPRGTAAQEALRVSGHVVDAECGTCGGSALVSLRYNGAPACGECLKLAPTPLPIAPRATLYPDGGNPFPTRTQELARARGDMLAGVVNMDPRIPIMLVEPIFAPSRGINAVLKPALKLGWLVELWYGSVVKLLRGKPTGEYVDMWILTMAKGREWRYGSWIAGKFDLAVAMPGYRVLDNQSLKESLA